MAVSKTQNERPAINALIDLANGLETAAQGHTVQISNLQGALSSEISSRTSADTLLGNRILAEETAIGILQSFMTQLNSVMRFGVSGSPATVQGNNYYDGTVTYSNPYPANSVSFALAAFTSGIDQSDLEVTVSECTNEGFDYTVVNSSSTAATFTIGYFSIGLSID